jgi:hypothetical protein
MGILTTPINAISDLFGGGGGSPSAAPSDSASWYQIGPQLAQANRAILGLEADVRGNPILAAAIGPQVIEARNRYSDLLSYYIQGYGTAFGSPPDTTGLMGLGQWQVYVWAAVGAAGLLAAVYELNKYLDGVNVAKQTALLQQQNIGTALAMGRPDIAAKLGECPKGYHKQPDGQCVPDDFLSQYGLWIGGGILALFLLKDLL